MDGRQPQIFLRIYQKPQCSKYAQGVGGRLNHVCRRRPVHGIHKLWKLHLPAHQKRSMDRARNRFYFWLRCCRGRRSGIAVDHGLNYADNFQQHYADNTPGQKEHNSQSVKPSHPSPLPSLLLPVKAEQAPKFRV